MNSHRHLHLHHYHSSAALGYYVPSSVQQNSAKHPDAPSSLPDWLPFPDENSTGHYIWHHWRIIEKSHLSLVTSTSRPSETELYPPGSHVTATPRPGFGTRQPVIAEWAAQDHVSDWLITNDGGVGSARQPDRPGNKEVGF